MYNDASAFENPHTELTIVLTRLFDIMFPVSLFFGGIALAASVYNSLQHGLYTTLIVHISMYLVAVVTLFFRRRIPLFFIFYVMLGLIAIDIVYSLLKGGLATESMMSLAFLSVFVGFFFGLRAGIGTAAGGAVIVSIIGFAVCTGMWRIPAEATSPLQWIIQIALFGNYIVPLILTVNGMQNRMATSLQALGRSNMRLQQEIEIREKTERELQESEAKYRHMFENAVEGIFQASPEGKLLSVNPSFARMLGFNSPREMIEKTTVSGFDVYVDHEEKNRLKQLLETNGYLEAFEVQLSRKDGAVIWASMNVRSVHGEKGDLILYEGAIEDVTKRKLAETALQESEGKYRSVVENSLIAFYIIQDNLFRFVNAQFCIMMGYVYEEIIDTLGLMDIVHPDDRNKVRDLLENHLSCGTENSKCEFRALRKDGRIITAKVFWSVLTYNGRAAAFGTLIDITKERSLESQLRQAQKLEAIGSLASGISHDFNNILTALLGYGELLKNKLDKTSPLRDYVDNMLFASEKATSLTKSLLAFSRQQPITLKPVNINMLVRGTEKLLKRLITEDITLVTQLADYDIMIMADQTQIDQILFNLTTNAKDAMPQGGTLKTSTSMVELDKEFTFVHGFGEAGRYALLSVSDTGIGMDIKTQEKIFEPFFTTKKIGKGTGLGLATVYGIVKQHNGYITVSSTPGEGTTFNIYIPTIKNKLNDIQPVTVTIRGGDEKILIAEDDDDVRPLVCELLQTYGYQTIEAVHGEDAVDIFKKHENIALAIIDSIMPKKNGKEVYHEIKKINPYVKVIFISGYSREVIFDKGIDDEEFNFISKPLSLIPLLQKVRAVLDA